MMTAEQYGQRARERAEFFRKATRVILGKDKRGHVMTIKRKAGPGIGNFADITRPMSAEKLTFVRTRAQKVAKEAIQRQWIIGNPFAAIRKRIVA